MNKILHDNFYGSSIATSILILLKLVLDEDENERTKTKILFKIIKLLSSDLFINYIDETPYVLEMIGEFFIQGMTDLIDGDMDENYSNPKMGKESLDIEEIMVHNYIHGSRHESHYFLNNDFISCLLYACLNCYKVRKHEIQHVLIEVLRTIEINKHKVHPTIHGKVEDIYCYLKNTSITKAEKIASPRVDMELI